jgi:hypothetical protein
VIRVAETRVIRRKVVIDVQFGLTERERKLMAITDEPQQGDGLEELRRELRRRLGR